MPASSIVEYRPVGDAPPRTIADPSLLTAHSLVLTGLQPGTTYRYHVRSAASGGTEGVSNDYVLTTAPSSSGPDISSLFVRQVSATTAMLAWVTSSGTAAQIEYGATANYGAFTLLKVYGAPTQDMTVDALRPSTTYHFRVKAWDGDGFLGASADATFTTASAGAATLLGEQNVQPDQVSLPAGQAVAYQYVASQSGLASVIRLYVDAGTSTPAFRVALYADLDGVPGAVLSQGSAPGLVAGWVDVNIPPVAVLQSTRYWVAVLTPMGAGNLNLRQAAAGGSSVTSAQTMQAALPQTWSVGILGARAPLSAVLLQVPPSVTLMTPADGSTVTGRVPVAAIVDDDVPLARVQFLVDGRPFGSPVSPPGPYATTWDSTGLNTNVPHVISVEATDILGRSSTSRLVSVQVDNGPLISRVTMSPGLTGRSARITWATDIAADGQVEYGTSPAYGSLTPVDGRPDVRHDMQLSGLLPSTAYHYRVRSRDANGALAVSADQIFFTP